MDTSNILFEIFSDLPREGPGDDTSTKQAFSLLKTLPKNPRILDIGCGTGAQTLALAKFTDGQIAGLDFHQPYLDSLEAKANQQGLSNRIETRLGDMNALPFDPESFDIIWAEGSIYIIGLKKGLQQWKKYIKPSGYLVFSHITFLQEDIPEELNAYWQKNYPQITTVDTNLSTIEREGYKNIGHFTLPASAWWKDFYTPLKKRLAALKEKHQNEPEALAELKETQVEINLYRKYSDYYGYVFYITQK